MIERASLKVPVEDLKMLRETLCLAQAALNHAYAHFPPPGGVSGKYISALIEQIDKHRPLGPDGKHGDRHTMTCGCEDKPVCVHCKEPIGRRDYDWTHCTGLYRCQSKDVPYGHLAHPQNYPCRADGPNACLGAFS